jgi:hypothetical protein
VVIWHLALLPPVHFALNLQWQTAFRATRIKWWTMDQRRHLVPALAVRDHNEQMHRIAWKPQFTTNASPPLRSIAAQYARKLIGANTSQSVESFKLARLLVEPLCFSKPSSTGYGWAYWPPPGPSLHIYWRRGRGFLSFSSVQSLYVAEL